MSPKVHSIKRWKTKKKKKKKIEEEEEEKKKIWMILPSWKLEEAT